MRQLIAEIEEHIKNGTSTYPGEQHFRVFWGGHRLAGPICPTT